LVVTVMLVSALGTGVIASPSGATGTGPSFTNTVLLRPTGGDEPAVAVGADGTVAVTALNPSSGLVNAFTEVWKGPFGATPVYQGAMDAHVGRGVGGADADVDLGSTGTFHGTSLVEVINPPNKREQLGISSVTCPGGDTSDGFAHCTVQLIDSAGTDRPFITSEGRHVYIVFHDTGSGAVVAQRSDDDGYTWHRAGNAIVGGGAITAGATFNDDLGPVVADPRTHEIYVSYASGEPGLNKAKTPPVHRKVYVARSRDLGAHWTSTLAFSAATGPGFGNPFVALAIDPITGRLAVAASDTDDAHLAVSADHGTTWSPDVRVNTSPATTAVFPWVAAYNGTIDVTYYGTPAASNLDPDAVWNTYLATSSDGVRFTQQALTTSPNHVGAICTDGDACPRGTRDLLDLFEVAINPRNGRAAIAYVKDDFGDPFRVLSGSGTGGYRFAEGRFTTSIAFLPGSEMRGPTTYVGTACSGDPVPPAIDDGDPSTQTIAVALPTASCRFDAEAANVIAAGYTGLVVIYPFGDDVFAMGGDPRAIPGVLVGRTTGLAIFGASSTADLVVGRTGSAISVGPSRPQVVLAQQNP
jgi:hypothetical protein